MNSNERFKEEYPYLEQTFSFKSGMRYRYSPDSYPILPNQLQQLKKAGLLIGNYLDAKKLGKSIIEFRIDFTAAAAGDLFINEVQTDDRGLPTMAIARNARGTIQPDIFPGVVIPLVRNIQKIVGSSTPKLLITYTEKEKFYYTPFYDLARLCWAEKPEIDIFVTPCEYICQRSNKIRVAYLKKDLTLDFKPDIIWDFTSTLDGYCQVIQQPVDKNLLIDIWRENSCLSLKLRQYVPQSMPSRELDSSDDKNQWVLKPISGKWSRGIMFGIKTDQITWRKALKGENLLAQRLVPPVPEVFLTREVKAGKVIYLEQVMYSRIEGYYARTDNDWNLVDVLATCTPDIPVHGKRDCIMIPGALRLDEE